MSAAEMGSAGPASQRRRSRGAKMLEAMGVDVPSPKKHKPSLPSVKRADVPKPSTSSPMVPEMPGALPMEYSQLLKILENLLLAYRIRPKGQMLSFAAAKQALSKMNVRMDIKQLAQIVYLCPDLTWENVQTTRNMTPREKLMICIPHLSSANCNADDEAIMKPMKQQLLQLAASGDTVEVPQAVLPDPACSLVNTPSGSSKRSSGSRSVMSPYVKSPASVRGPSFSTPRKPNDRQAKRALFMSPTPKMLGPRLTSQKLASVVEGSEPVTQGSTGEHTPMAETSLKQMRGAEGDLQTPVGIKRKVVWDDDTMAERNEDLQENSALGALSSQSRKIVRETMQQRDLMSPEKVEGRRKGHALSILLESFDTIRAVFHRENATMMNLETAVEKIRLSQGGKKGPTGDTIHFNLLVVLEHASPYLKLESSGSKQGKILVIDPTCDVKQVRDHLKHISKNRDVLEMEDDKTG